jgi:polyhydroxyalkanoate synthesis regulator phasin
MLDSDTSLLAPEQSDELRERWDGIQSAFVDEPQTSVEEADALVTDLMQRITGRFSSERQHLEDQWAKGDDVSTEDLRVVLTRYRSFFDRLLSA